MSDPRPSFLDPFDDAPWSTPREIFARLGFFPPSPEEIPESEVRGRLWELVHAMAARRFYLINTNHLSDLELLSYLHQEWLDESTADMPPESGWNCHIDVSESAKEEVWLRYYADEVDRVDWKSTHPDADMPEHEDPPHERDDWLPVPPPIQTEETVDFVGGGSDFTEDFGSGNRADDDEDEDDDLQGDPLGLREVEDAIHSADPLGTGFEEMQEDSADDDGDKDDGEEDFPGRWARPMDLLDEQDVYLLPPAELTDESVAPLLWEILHAMACMGVYVRHTDHLTDRELYEALWASVLRDEAFVPGDGMEAAWAHDFIGSDAPEDRRIRLSYYASDEERQAAAAESGGPLPPREEPIANRDWRLPSSPLGL